MLRMLPHRLYVMGLTEDEELRRIKKLPEREYAYEKLKKITGEDFGYDSKKWEDWMTGKTVQEIYAGGEIKPFK